MGGGGGVKDFSHSLYRRGGGFMISPIHCIGGGGGVMIYPIHCIGGGGVMISPIHCIGGGGGG